MKIRSGFVSNSSSSSFVAVGFDVDPDARASNVAKLREYFGLPAADDRGETENADDLYYAKRDSGVWYMTSTESGSPSDDRHVVCQILTEVRGYDVEPPIDAPVGGLFSRVEKLAELFGVDAVEVRLYVGTRAGYM